ncbi:MAG: preprotein translocase subunit SecE [Alphaproteobacteria bacterium]|nr:preprotein translocase subunit SecE [Alphaproteobacteria bacterium]
MKVSIAQSVRQVKQEVSKITWPTRKETMQGSVIVIVMSVLIALFLFFVDMIFAGIIQAILEG